MAPAKTLSYFVWFIFGGLSQEESPLIKTKNSSWNEEINCTKLCCCSFWIHNYRWSVFVFRAAEYCKILGLWTLNGSVIIIAWSILEQFHSLFQSEFSKECHLELCLPISSIFSFPEEHPVAAYVFFPLFPSFYSSFPLITMAMYRL